MHLIERLTHTHTLVLHVADDVAADSILGHRAGLALLGLVALWPSEHPPERGGDAAARRRRAPRGGPRPPGEAEGAEEQPLRALRLLHVWERARAEEEEEVEEVVEKARRPQRQRSPARPHGCLRSLGCDDSSPGVIPTKWAGFSVNLPACSSLC